MFKEYADSELIARVAKNDMAALGELAIRHQRWILSLAYRFLGTWEGAEDVGQDVILRVYKAADRYQPTAKFSTWLYRIVVNACLDRRRSASNRHICLGETDCAGTAGADELVARKEVINIVRKAVRELPDRQRMVLLLHRYDGLSHSQISQATGLSCSAVESLMVRAYKSLRVKLNGFGGGHERKPQENSAQVVKMMGDRLPVDMQSESHCRDTDIYDASSIHRTDRIRRRKRR